MALTRAEKAAGRRFREDQTRWLLEDTERLKAAADADERLFFVVPPFLAHYRHLCPHNKGVSTAMRLVEEYIYSPRYLVYEIQRKEPRDPAAKPEFMVLTTEPVEGQAKVKGATLHEVPPRRFGFTYKKGKCVCGATSQSRVGKLVDAEVRPPIRGRDAR